MSKKNSQPNVHHEIEKIEFAKVEKRAHPRFELKLKCEISNSDSTVNTFTKDVSIGGVGLETEVPKEMLSSPCKIKLWNQDESQSIEFNLHLGSAGIPKYFYFSQINESDIHKLEIWLIHHCKVEIKNPKFKV